MGLGYHDVVNDPFIRFSDTSSLFELNTATERWEVSEAHWNLFDDESFSARKRPNEYRIFCLGGSTVQGRPYGIETSFTTWLELNLNAAHPERTWEVVNCGGASYASYRLVSILEETLQYEPDLYVLYTGHNEFLEERTYATIKNTPAPLKHAHRAMTNLRSYNLLRGWLAPPPPPPNRLPGDPDALLDYQNGLEAYHRDDAWRDAVIEHFELNLRGLIALVRAHGKPIILVNPVCDLRRTPPFKFVSTSRRANELWALAKQQPPAEAIKTLQQAVSLDPRNAGILFHLAQCHVAVGQVDEADKFFLQAKEEDICPLRILEPMRQKIKQVAAETNTPLLDAESLFAEAGSVNLLVDHVHPSFRGHQLIAEGLLETLAEMNIADVKLAAEDRAALYARHFETLDVPYFERGKRRLEGLRLWTQGKATKERP